MKIDDILREVVSYWNGLDQPVRLGVLGGIVVLLTARAFIKSHRDKKLLRNIRKIRGPDPIYIRHDQGGLGLVNYYANNPAAYSRETREDRKRKR